jgi:UDP-N-acetylglucosamine--N-acetylmuramyl-(pentapeptide) pyrophosphoryl-undecaprenol N-acetylglucosamine transferase
VIQDQALNAETLLAALQEVINNKSDIDNKIKALKIESATDKIVAIIKEQAHVQSPRTV